MSVILNYTASEYKAKVTELEGHYNVLATHLDRMKSLKEEMFDFWDDENARNTGLVLAEQIRLVESAMDTTRTTLNQYNTAIAELTQTNNVVSSTIEMLLGGLKAF